MIELPIIEMAKGHLMYLHSLLGLPDWSLGALFVFGAGFTLVNFVMLSVLFLIWLERKVAGHIQCRPGPLFVGPHGILVTLADGIKLVQKEELIPRQADHLLFRAAPYFVFTAVFMSFALVPFSQWLVAANVNVGLLMLFAFTTYVTLGVLLAGWSSNSKYPAFGGMRAAAQALSYEIPLVLSSMGVIMLAGSLNLQEIVMAQQNSVWFILLQPLGFILFFVSALAEVNRPPFDLPEGESELVAGYHSEYSGLRFSMFFMAEWAATFLMSAIITTLFLGGWSGPSFLPGIAWFFIKTYAVVLTMMWIRWTVPRLRIDQVLNLGWKSLIPLSILNILLTAGVMVIL